MRENCGHAHGLASLCFVVGVGLRFDFPDHAPDLGLALGFRQMPQTRQRGQLDVVGGGELRGMCAQEPGRLGIAALPRQPLIWEPLLYILVP